MNSDSLPIAAIVPTRDRPGALARMLESLAAQCVLPAEVIIVDASGDDASRRVAAQCASQWAPRCRVLWQAAAQPGAAVQRNQGLALTTQPFAWFFDDDVLFEGECLAQLWRGLQSDRALGGVNATITNQRYHPPGAISGALFALMNGRREPTYAGRVLGPALNLLPEDRPDLPEIVPVEWLNLGCTLYRRDALPQPAFEAVFTGYSLMEDLALSLRVGRKWKLANVRKARIFHDSQPGPHKSDPCVLGRMELVNRHYVMTRILGRRRLRDYSRLCLWELFQLAVAAKSERLRKPFWRMLQGKLQAIRCISYSIHAEPATADG